MYKNISVQSKNSKMFGYTLYFLILTTTCWSPQCLSEILPAWQQYYPSTQSWSHQSTTSYNSDTLSLRPPRHRVGQGRYRLIPPTSAELNCDFPESMLMISNVVWERADIGSRDLHQIYKRAGVPHQYDVHIRPRGSTLHIFDVTPLDRGVYRCIATGMDPGTNSVVTLFQDTEFFPEQTLPLTNLIKRDYIVPAASVSTPVYFSSTYYKPSTVGYYSGYNTVPHSMSTPSYPTASYPTASYPSSSYSSPSYHSASYPTASYPSSNYHSASYPIASYTPSHPTSSSYTVDSDFIYSNGNSIKQPDEQDSNKIYVYDKGYHSYASAASDRVDMANGTLDTGTGDNLAD